VVKGSEEEVWKQKRNEIETSIPWYNPKKIRPIEVRRGMNSKEIINQDQRTKEKYPAIYLNDLQIPFSPSEPLKQEEDDTDCVQIPLEKPPPEMDNLLNKLKYFDVNLITALLTVNLQQPSPDLKNLGQMNGIQNNPMVTNNISNPHPSYLSNYNNNINLSFLPNPNPNPNPNITHNQMENPKNIKHKGRIVCRFYNTTGCTKGESCHYLHVNPGDPIPNENFNKSGNRGGRGGKRGNRK